MICPVDSVANKIYWLYIAEVLSGDIFMIQQVSELFPCRESVIQVTCFVGLHDFFFLGAVRIFRGSPTSNLTFIGLDRIPVKTDAEPLPQHNTSPSSLLKLGHP